MDYNVSFVMPALSSADVYLGRFATLEDAVQAAFAMKAQHPDSTLAELYTAGRRVAVIS